MISKLTNASAAVTPSSAEPFDRRVLVVGGAAFAVLMAATADHGPGRVADRGHRRSGQRLRCPGQRRELRPGAPLAESRAVRTKCHLL
jgi:hypothetical protein